jgi:hypothetical protein
MKPRIRKGGPRVEIGGLRRLSLSTTKDVSQEKRHRLSLSKLAKSKECPVRIDKLLRGRIIDHLLLLLDVGSFSKSDPSELSARLFICGSLSSSCPGCQFNDFYRAL